MKITVLVENRVLKGKKNLIAEHGLCLHISHNNQNILFDTGQSNAFIKNASQLNINLNNINAAILSHHHYDHAGGMPYFLIKNEKSKIYLKKNKNSKLYVRSFGIVRRYLGIDQKMLHDYHKRFVFIEKPTEILPDIFILTDIIKKYPMPHGNQYLFAKKDNKYIHDSFDHELILVIKGDNGLVVFTGCSHNGVLNMIETVMQYFPNTPIKTVIGGFHLIDIPIICTILDKKDDVEYIANTLLKYPIETLYTGHCTSTKSYMDLKKILGDKLQPCPTGKIIET